MWYFLCNKDIPTLLFIQHATMCVAPLSISSEREAAIDFTNPFKTRAINVLLKTPEIKVSYFEVRII